MQPLIRRSSRSHWLAPMLLVLGFLGAGDFSARAADPTEASISIDNFTFKPGQINALWAPG